MKLGLRIAVSAALLTLLFLLLPWQGVRTAVERLSLGLWFGVLAGFAVGHAVGVVKWRLAVNLGRAGLAGRDAVRCYSAGLFANLCLPSIVGGDVLRAALAGRRTGRPEAVVWGGIMDRLSDVAALALLIAGGAALARESLPGVWSQVLTALLAVGLGVVGILLPLALRGRPLARWPRRLRRPVGRAMVAARQLVRRPGKALTLLGLSLTIQAGFVLLNARLGGALGISVPLATWFLVWPLAKLAGLLPISLGGLAVREATLAALLAPFGVAPALGVVTSLAWQTVLIGGGLLGGGIWLILTRWSRAANGAGLFSAQRMSTDHG